MSLINESSRLNPKDLGPVSGHTYLGPIRRVMTIIRWVPSSPLDPGHYEYEFVDLVDDEGGGIGDYGGDNNTGGVKSSGGGPAGYGTGTSGIVYPVRYIREPDEDGQPHAW